MNAGVAQLVEQLTCNQQVVGSSPIASSIRLAFALLRLARFDMLTASMADHFLF